MAAWAGVEKRGPKGVRHSRSDTEPATTSMFFVITWRVVTESVGCCQVVVVTLGDTARFEIANGVTQTHVAKIRPELDHC